MTAARTDVQFALLWDRRDRVLIPELVVFHLEPEAAPMGANWNGPALNFADGTPAGVGIQTDGL